MVKPACAQSIPKPSVPEFTLKFVDKSHDVSPTTTSSTDPYNGKTTTQTIPGYHVKDLTIEITIKNQLFPSIIDGNASNLYYNIRIKGHFADYWNVLYYTSGSDPGSLPIQSSSQYTVLSLPANYQSDDQVDIEVQAILGYNYNHPNHEHIMPPIINVFAYQLSDWSPTQTFTMPNTSTNIHLNLVNIGIIAVVIIIIAIVSCLLLFRRHRNLLQHL